MFVIYSLLMSIHLALQEILKARNYPMAQFARDLGMQRGYLYKIVRGIHSPTLFTLERIAGGLDMRVSELIAFAELLESKHSMEETEEETEEDKEPPPDDPSL